jgi:hypothetical protein
LAEIIRFRMLMIAAGYEDGNDANTLRGDPIFKLALDRLPPGEELCSQSTVSQSIHFFINSSLCCLRAACSAFHSGVVHTGGIYFGA